MGRLLGFLFGGMFGAHPRHLQSHIHPAPLGLDSLDRVDSQCNAAGLRLVYSRVARLPS